MGRPRKLTVGDIVTWDSDPVRFGVVVEHRSDPDRPYLVVESDQHGKRIRGRATWRKAPSLNPTGNASPAAPARYRRTRTPPKAPKMNTQEHTFLNDPKRIISDMVAGGDQLVIGYRGKQIAVAQVIRREGHKITLDLFKVEENRLLAPLPEL